MQQQFQRQTPQDYGIREHNEWRPGQREAADVCLAEIRPAPPHGLVVMEAPTGSGKTSIVKALATDHAVIALSRTKSLQAENYGGTYGFDILFGRGNYRCAHPEANAYATADDCLYGERMMECPVADECPYLLAKHRAQASKIAALNYSYWLTSRWPRESEASALALDEAHLLSEIVLDFAGITVTEAQRREFGLPGFPTVSSAGSRRASFAPGDPLAALYQAQASPHQKILDWLADALPIAQAVVESIRDASDQRRLRAAQGLARKLESSFGALDANRDDWYIKSGHGVRWTPTGNEPGLIARPLTARYHFPRYFLNSAKRGIVAMSATIGDPDTFAAELGIKEFSFHRVPKNPRR